MENKKNETESNKLLKFGGGLIVLITLLNTWQIFSIKSVVDSVDNYNKGVVDELGGIVGDTKQFAQDLNEIRRFLLLPEKNYSTSQGDNTQENDQQTDPNSLALYAFLEDLNKSEKAELNKAGVSTLLKDWQSSSEIRAKLSEYKLEVEAFDNWQVKLLDLENQKQPLVAIVFSPLENVFKLQSVLGEEKVSDLQLAGFSSSVDTYLKNNTASIRQKKADKLKEDQSAKTNAAAMEEQRKKDLRDNFERLISEAAFVDTISTLGLSVDKNNVNLEKGNWVYNVKTVDGKIRFAFLLDSLTGQIKVLKDNQEIDLKNFLNLNEGSKKKP